MKAAVENHRRARVAIFALLCGLVAAPAPVCGQVHKVEKPQKVVRAVGVYEWTGDMAKPTGSRLIPVSLFIDGALQDADVYEARPVPFALDAGNVYELERAGVVKGTLDIAFARKLIPTPNASSSWDDGWFGYGKFFPPAPPPKSPNLKATTVAKINGIDDQADDSPHFSARSAAPGSGAAATPLPGSAAAAAAAAPVDDPDRPMLHRGTDDKNAASDVPDDPDRPKLRKHTEPPAGVAMVNEDVTAIGGPTSDPNRPQLHRGKPVSAMRDDDIPKLTGLPEDRDLQQMVAVSDAADRPQHDFSRPWADDAEQATIRSRMQRAARAALTAYEKPNVTAPAGSAPALKRTPAAASAHHTTAKKPAPAPAPEPLLDEKLTGYLLSYGGAPTFVYSAHTDGTNGAVRYVTLVAQNDMQGEAEVVLKSVTDAEHLDRTPRMRLVDAVDAEASNRASLLFELRAQNTRQFALYRVLGGRANQTFVSGATQ